MSDPPFFVDLREQTDAQVAEALRAERQDVTPAQGGLVGIDLGERRSLSVEAIDELVFTHRAFCEAGGRLAVVGAAALAAQISLAHPEGLLWVTGRDAAIAMLQRGGVGIEVRVRVTRAGMRVDVEGGLGHAGLPLAESDFVRVVAFADKGREIVFDVSQLTFVDVGGLQAITYAAVRSRLAGANFHLIGAGPQLVRLACRLGWQDQLPGLVEPDGLRPARSPIGRSTAAGWRDLVPMLHHSSKAVIATDLSGTVTHWNAAAHRLYGWSPAEALGRPIHELTVAPHNELAAHEVMAIVRRTGVWEGEFTVRRKDGATFLAHIRNAVVEDGYGRVAGVVGISVTARTAASA